MTTTPRKTLPLPIELLETRIAPAAAVFNLATLTGSTGTTVTGAAEGDGAGSSVTGIDDINGDFIPDFVVAAPQSDIFASNAGSLAVIFGNAEGLPANIAFDSLTGSDGFLIRGPSAGAMAGVSVAAGDVNGDGIEDVVIGAPYANAGSGAVYVVFGQRTPFPAQVNLAPGTAGTGVVTIFGAAAGDLAGSSVSTADFNRDGRDDVIIGAPGAAAAGAGAGFGAAYVVLGSQSFSNVGLDDFSGFKLSGEAPGDFLGSSVSSAGDVNGDNVEDIILGASGADSRQQDSGAAYVIFGGVSPTVPLTLGGLDGSNGFKVTGEAADDGIGLNVAAAGDVNGDLVDDLIIGVPAANPNGDGSGAAYVVYGARIYPAVIDLASVAGTVGFKIQGVAAGDRAGASISLAGDFNNDGVDDLIIGAPGANANTGAAYILLGSSTGFTDVVNLSSLDGTNGFKIVGIGSGDLAGVSVRSVGDINDDDFEDVVIGAAGVNASGAGSGAAYVVYGFDTRIDIDPDGRSFTFTEDDGDVVTVSLSRAGLTGQAVTFAEDGSIETLDLSGMVPPAALGLKLKPLNLNISVKTGESGNGMTKVGFLNADGLSLGTFKMKGDLGRLVAGSANGGMGVKNLKIAGNLGSITGTATLSQVFGGMAKMVVGGDFLNNSLQVDGKIKNIKIVGDMIGDLSIAPATLAQLADTGFADGPELGANPAGVLLAQSFGKMKLGGSMKGGGVTTSKEFGTLAVGGDLSGSSIFGGEGIKAVKVVGKMTSDDPNAPVTMTARNNLGALIVNGDMENARILVGYNNDEVPVNPDAKIGKVLVKGNWVASSLVAGIADSTNDGFGRNDIIIAGDTTAAVSKIASVVIKGTAMGSAATGDHFGITAQKIGKLSINDELVPLTGEADDLLLDTTNNDFRVVEFGAI